MKIFFQNIHRRLPKSLAKAIEKSGGTVLLPDESFKCIIKYGEYQSQEEISRSEYTIGCKNIKAISYQELMRDQPDVILISCYEVEKDIIENIWNKIDRTKTKLAYYNGNNNFYCNWDYANNIITTDVVAAQKAKFKNKNCIIWLPWVDFDNEFCFAGVNNSNIFNSYISKYNTHFPNDYRASLRLSELLKTKEVQFNIHESLEFNNVAEIMKDSCGTIHIKSLEGYGYSIIESISRGRMVFLYRPYSKDKTYTNWCIEDKTCFYFDSEEELYLKIKKYRENVDIYQPHASKTIKELINNDRQSERLIKFMNTLR